MNYSKTKAKALFLTATRQLDHVIFEINGGYDVVMAKYWTGPIYETVKYEAEKENKIEDKPKKATSKRTYPSETNDQSETV